MIEKQAMHPVRANDYDALPQLYAVDYPEMGMGVEFTDINGFPWRAQMWGGEPWLFRWNGRNWVSIRHLVPPIRTSDHQLMLAIARLPVLPEAMQ